jgi:hypothetical protein
MALMALGLCLVAFDVHVGDNLDLVLAMNGRGSANFLRGNRSNIRFVLPQGSVVQVTKKIRMLSGNYGLKVKVLKGPNQGAEDVWIYYDVHDPAFKLYKSDPTKTQARKPAQETKSPEDATHAKTIRDTPATREEMNPAAEQAPKDDESDIDVAGAIDCYHRMQRAQPGKFDPAQDVPDGYMIFQYSGSHGSHGSAVINTSAIHVFPDTPLSEFFGMPANELEELLSQGHDVALNGKTRNAIHMVMQAEVNRFYSRWEKTAQSLKQSDRRDEISREDLAALAAPLKEMDEAQLLQNPGPVTNPDPSTTAPAKLPDSEMPDLKAGLAQAMAALESCEKVQGEPRFKSLVKRAEAGLADLGSTPGSPSSDAPTSGSPTSGEAQ